MVKFNLNKNAIEKFGYEHPKATGNRSMSSFKLSIDNGIYVNCYTRCDLMTICDLKGDLKYNVYGGGDWFNKDRKNDYYQGVGFFKSNIIAAYNGDVAIIFDESKRPVSNWPSKFIIFDMDGNYKKTIETESKFSAFCVDEENSRLIAYFENRQNPLGYFALDFD